MTVDIKLNNMIDALGRLERVRLEDVELSVRAHNALKNDGCVTLADVQHRINKGTLRRIPNIGRRTAAEIQEIIDNVLALPHWARLPEYLTAWPDTAPGILDGIEDEIAALFAARDAALPPPAEVIAPEPDPASEAGAGTPGAPLVCDTFDAATRRHYNAELKRAWDHVDELRAERDALNDKLAAYSKQIGDVAHADVAQLLKDNRRLNSELASARAEPDRIKRLLDREREHTARLQRRIDAVVGLLTVADLRRAGIDVDITFNEED